MPKYVAIQAWHIISHPFGTGYVTRCGRQSAGPTTDELPLDQKSCETCLRLKQHDADR